ncbi:hypothetical protein AB0M00_43790 [Streptomyces chartreusis]|uniref:hypothetical protein n=1 Tax=Streptomyces chartreusis TaxID=1969 RepID=UPI003434EDB1
MGQDTAAAAASALRLLNTPELRHHPQHGPQERRAPTSVPAAPVNLGLIDYLEARKREVIDHARTVTTRTEPLPLDDSDLYAWYLRATIGAAEADRRHRDFILARHALEHAIRLGNYNAVRPHPCPTCGGWGLFWDERGNRARCSDLDCRTPDGLASSFTLDRLAAQQVGQTEIWRSSAT